MRPVEKRPVGPLIWNALGFSESNLPRAGALMHARHEVFTPSSDLPKPKLNGPKRVSLFMELCSQFVCDLVRVQSVIEEKLDDHSLLVLHQNWAVNVT